jgi:[lysine-biosynthesis-protein LysW]--L-2-aminoadipate ligase
MLCSRVRVEEKMLFAALRAQGVDLERIDPRKMALDLVGDGVDDSPYAAVLVRCLSHSRAFYISRWLNDQGVPTVNPHAVIATCGDKMLASLALRAARLPVPRTVIAFTPESTLEVMDEMGYPVVLKPLVGSWGRLLARVSDRYAAEAILEHKNTLGGYLHSIFYVQDYVDKPDRDIRTMVVGDEVVYAIYRWSSHWITNTAQGGEARPCPLSPEIAALSLAAAKAVGGGVVTVDLLETSEGQLLVNEVNHTPEFHGAAQVVEADIAGKIIDYTLKIAARGPSDEG